MSLFSRTSMSFTPDKKVYSLTVDLIPQYIDKFFEMKVPEKLVEEFTRLYIEKNFEQLSKSINKKALMNQIYVEVARRISIKKPRKRKK